MDPNTSSTDDPGGHPDDLAELTRFTDRLAARDLDQLSDTVRAERVLALRRLVERLEGQWLKELAGVDAHGGRPGPNRAWRPAQPPPGSATACG